MKSSVWKRNRGKILIAIAALLIALIAAIGSGAYFSATASNNGNAFTAGTMSLNNGGASLNVGPLFPGHPLTGTLTITNNNATNGELYLNQSNLAGPAGFIAAVNVTISNGGTALFGAAPLSLFPGGGIDVGPLAASGGSVTLTWTASLPETGADQNALQGATMTCDYTWTLQSL
jgi:hypothetical protein